MTKAIRSDNKQRVSFHRSERYWPDDRRFFNFDLMTDIFKKDEEVFMIDRGEAIVFKDEADFIEYLEAFLEEEEDE